MRISRLSTLAAAVLAATLLAGCHSGPDRVAYVSALNGEQQVPPVKTDAYGTARFDLMNDGKTLHYVIRVYDLNDVNMAHLHLAQAGSKGKPIAWLYPTAPPPKVKAGVTNGQLAEGRLTAGDLVGPMKGKSIADLVDEMRHGNVYVNVHTKEHMGGEIRGQLFAE